MTNPFHGKTPPTPPGTPPAKSQGPPRIVPPSKQLPKLSEEESEQMLNPTENICPFMGSKVIPVPKQGMIQSAGKPEIELVMSFSPCIGARCHLWDADGGMCSLKSGFQVLHEIKEGLAPLKNFFNR